MTLRLVVLDVNETLSDMAPLADRFVDVGAPRGLSATWFASILRDGFALTVTGEQAAFADLGAAALRALLDEEATSRAGYTVPDAIEHVMDAFTSLEVHPDVGPGLAALAASGVRVVTLSNGSAEVGRSLLRRAGVAEHVEHVLSVEDAGLWKPAPAAYAHALSVCEVDSGEAMLVAVHPWDIHGAHRAGLRTGWVNRTAASYPAAFSAPDLVAGDLVQLASRLG